METGLYKDVKVSTSVNSYFTVESLGNFQSWRQTCSCQEWLKDIRDVHIIIVIFCSFLTADGVTLRFNWAPEDIHW